MNFKIPRPQSLKEHTVEALRQAIVRGDLRPGSRLVEQSLAEQMGVSRGPVREAIQQLEGEGLVVTSPRRGAEVKPIAPKDAWEIYTIRSNFEAFALQLAPGPFEAEEIERLRNMVRDMQAAHEQGRVDALVNLDLEFHGFFVERADHQRLCQQYHSLDSAMAAIYFMVLRDLNLSTSDTAKRHETIVDAAEHGSTQELIQAITEHYHRPAGMLLTLLSDAPRKWGGREDTSS